MLMALAAAVLAVVLTGLSFPLFNKMTGMGAGWSLLIQPRVILFILAVLIITGLLSGVYPSAYLASFNPVAVLKGNGASERDRGWFRRGLVIMQFLIASVMIIGAIVVALQMGYIRSKDLGFDKDKILLLSLNDTAVVNNVNAFMEEIRRHPAVEGTALSTSAPGRFYGKQVMTLEGNNGEMEEKAINQFFVDYDYLDVMGLTLVKGRFFDRQFGSDDETSFVVNEALVREMQWGDSVIGRKFIRGVNIQGANNPVGEVIGVVKDFNYGSLHNPVESLVLVCRENAQFMRTLSVRISGGQMAEVLDWIKEKRQEFHPAYPIEYSYLSDELDNLYREEKVIFALVIAFTALIIFIAALGLLGLSAFMTHKRTRDPQSNGGIPESDPHPVPGSVFPVGDHCQHHCLAPFFPGNAKLASEFHFPDRISFLDLYPIFAVIIGDCCHNSQLAIH